MTPRDYPLCSSALLLAEVDGRLAQARPCVYAAYAPEYRAVYIGQTMAREGALSRLSQHLSEGASNTFRQRVSKLHRLEDAPFGLVHFSAYPLDRDPFRALAYREAIEASVQRRVLKLITSGPLRAGVVSRIHSNGYADLDWLKDLADRIGESFYRWFESVYGVVNRGDLRSEGERS